MPSGRRSFARSTGHIDRVDLLVGSLAENPPKGFGFSDTAFRIFILMASRRIKSDRFFTEDYNSRLYSQIGLDWISQNDMSSVLLRHYPELGPALWEARTRSRLGARCIKGRQTPQWPRRLAHSADRAAPHRYVRGQHPWSTSVACHGGHQHARTAVSRRKRPPPNANAEPR